jgi:hypothetical protein
MTNKIKRLFAIIQYTIPEMLSFRSNQGEL